MQNRPSSFIESTVSYTTSMLQWLFLTEDGQGMVQRRTEYASDALQEAREKDQKFYSAPMSRMFQSPQLVVLDPSVLTGSSIQQISSGTDDPKAREPFNNFKNMIGLGNNTPLSWVFKQDKQAYNDRQILGNLMRPDKFPELEKIIQRKLEDQLPILKNIKHESVDFCLYQWIHQLTMDIIAEHVLGIHYFPNSAHFVLDSAEVAIVREGEPINILGYDIAITESQQRYKIAKESFLDFAKELIDYNEEDIKNSNGFLNAILKIEAQSRNQSIEDALQHPEVRKILSCAAAGLLFASGTLSTSLAVGLAYLDEELLAKLQTNNTIEQGNFWDAYFKEAIRYTSSAAHNLRYASKEKTLQTESGEEIKIAKDSYIVVDHRRSHQNKKTWGDPEKFQPERFFSQTAPKLNTPKFTPFSFGPRMCPGRQVAEVIFKKTVAFFLEHNISIQLKDAEFKDIFNEEYWTSSDFVSRLRSGKRMVANTIISNQQEKLSSPKL